jgi:hypothetical protein
MELSPFAVNLTSKSPYVERSFKDKSDLVVTRAEDGFTLKQKGRRISFQPYSPVKKTPSKVRRDFFRKSQLEGNPAFNLYQKYVNSNHSWSLTYVNDQLRSVSGAQNKF